LFSSVLMDCFVLRSVLILMDLLRPQVRPHELRRPQEVFFASSWIASSSGPSLSSWISFVLTIIILIRPHELRRPQVKFFFGSSSCS
jgi:hypothetical protein